jgi:PrtD family type I secretion system ABC transporter
MVATFTAVINLLALSGSLFMLEVYNRVLPSRSLPTLAGLVILMILLLASQGMLDILRARLLVRIGNFLHERTSLRAFHGMLALPVRSGSSAAGRHPIRDLDTVRSFLSSQGPAALCDLPWFPLYLCLLFIFHPYLGMVALIGALLVVSLTLLTEALTRQPLAAAVRAAGERDGLGEACRRNAETVLTLGMAGWMATRWQSSDAQALAQHRRASDVALGLSAAARMLRLMVQSAVLAVGAMLVIRQQATGGLIVASAILVARALAPIDVAISHWRGFVAARQSWRRLTEVLSLCPDVSPHTALPPPRTHLTVEHVSVAPPGVQALVLQDISFALRRGDALGVIGPSASGKSSLARALVGVWPAVRGAVRLDGAAIPQWSPETLGRHIGYLPQQVELLAGTIAENVARFDPAATSADILKAAEAAGVHELILSLPGGYDTRIGPGFGTLSAGQQQRIALARALYRDPFLVVLDEPNASLDKPGETALSKAIRGVRDRGGIVVVISHRQSALEAVGHLLVMFAGRVDRFGPKQEILAPPSPPRVVATVRASGERRERVR